MISSRVSKSFLVVAAVLLLTFGAFLVSQYFGGPTLALGRIFWPTRTSGSSEAQIAEWQARASEADRLKLENEQLRTLLGRSAGAQSNPQVARVLPGWPQGPFDVLALDLGRDNSAPPLAVGERVLAPGAIWLGEISAVYGATSKVNLLSLPGRATPARLGADRLPLTLFGRGGGNFLATLPLDLPVKPGDQALFAGPRADWLVAVVGAVEIDQSQDEQKIFLQSPVKAAQLAYVLVEPN